MTAVSTYEMPSVLVLLAARNGVNWILEQIDSIFAQEGVLVSLLVRDDCSADTTIAAVTERFAGDNRLRIFPASKPSGSAGASFFELIRLASFKGFDYIALADQDDVWLPNKLIRAVVALRSSSAGGYSSSVEAFWPSGRTKKLSQSANKRKADFFFEGAGQGCTFVLPAASFSNVQKFVDAESIVLQNFKYHDWLIYLVVRALKEDWYFDQNVSMLYRQHESNEIGARGGVSSIIRRLHLVRSGWYLEQVKLASQIFKKINQIDGENLKFVDALNSSPSFFRQFFLAKFSFSCGRRKIVDRALVSIFFLFFFM